MLINVCGMVHIYGIYTVYVMVLMLLLEYFQSPLTILGVGTNWNFLSSDKKLQIRKIVISSFKIEDEKLQEIK